MQAKTRYNGYHTVHRRFNVISCPCKPASRGSLESRAFTDRLSRRCIASRQHAQVDRANVRNRRFPRKKTARTKKKNNFVERNLGRCSHDGLLNSVRRQTVVSRSRACPPSCKPSRKEHALLQEIMQATLTMRRTSLNVGCARTRDAR